MSSAVNGVMSKLPTDIRDSAIECPEASARSDVDVKTEDEQRSEKYKKIC